MHLHRKKQHNEYHRNYRAPNSSLQFLVIKFHDIVSQGPVFICTCCDQLWYKHNVLHADKLRHSNPEIDKYPCNKKSVNNIEWVCKTCNNHLIKNSIYWYGISRKTRLL